MKLSFKRILDPRILIPPALIILLELFLRTGLYEPFLKPKSSARNVLNVVTVAQNSRVNPEMMVLGTSVAFQAVRLPYLNRLLENEGLVVQSGACESARLVTQHLIYRELKDKPSLKTILHIVDPIFPWTVTRKPDPHNLSMALQFREQSATLQLFKAYGIQLGASQRRAFQIRLLAYQKDLRDGLLNLPGRIKSLSRAAGKGRGDFYYVNNNEYIFSGYRTESPRACVESVSRLPRTLREDKSGDIFDRQGRKVSDTYHRQTVGRTCEVVAQDYTLRPGSEFFENLFFERLAQFYAEIRGNGHKIITVFPPYAPVARGMNSDRIIDVWRKRLNADPRLRPEHILDLRDAINTETPERYYSDALHLNRHGAGIFTEALARKLKTLRRPGHNGV